MIVLQLRVPHALAVSAWQRLFEPDSRDCVADEHSACSILSAWQCKSECRGCACMQHVSMVLT
jgi:hypothetical protein